MNTITLFRPVGPAELDLIRLSGWKKFPPRLPDQPFFYPVMNEAYATQITKEWNVPSFGSGFVLRFRVEADYLSRYQVQNVGSTIHDELWVPSEEMEEFNSHIVGLIQLVGEFFAV